MLDVFYFCCIIFLGTRLVKELRQDCQKTVLNTMVVMIGLKLTNPLISSDSAILSDARSHGPLHCSVFLIAKRLSFFEPISNKVHDSNDNLLSYNVFMLYGEIFESLLILCQHAQYQSYSSYVQFLLQSGILEWFLAQCIWCVFLVDQFSTQWYMVHRHVSF